MSNDICHFDAHIYITTLKLCFHQILCLYIRFTTRLYCRYNMDAHMTEVWTAKSHISLSQESESEIFKWHYLIRQMDYTHAWKKATNKPCLQATHILIWVIQLWFKQEFTQCSSYLKDIIAFSVIQIACRHRTFCLRIGPYLDFCLCSSPLEKPDSSSWDPPGYKQICFCPLQTSRPISRAVP